MGWSISRLRNIRSTSKRRHKSLAVTCALVIATGIAGHSQAQLYKWVDENGKVQYSDTVPPAAVDRARKELRSDGTVKNETQRAANAEERRLAAQSGASHYGLRISESDGARHAAQKGNRAAARSTADAGACSARCAAATCSSTHCRKTAASTTRTAQANHDYSD